MKKRITILCLLLCLMIPATAYAASSETVKATISKLKMYFDGSQVNGKVLTYNKVNYVPVSLLTDKLGFKVTTSTKTNKITITEEVSKDDLLIENQDLRNQIETLQAELAKYEEYTTIDNIKVYKNDQLLSLTNGNKGIIDQHGNIYLPADTLESFSYDDMSVSIYYGSHSTGEVTYIDELSTLSGSGYNWKYGQSAITNMGKQYYHSFVSGDAWNNSFEIKYAITGQYSRLKGIIAPLDGWNSRSVGKNIGTIQIYGDNKLLYDSGITPSDTITEKIVDLDITGVQVLKIVKEQQSYGSGSGYMGFCDVKLVK